MAEIRPVRLTDAEKFRDLQDQLDRETPFMLMEPGELSGAVSDWEKRIAPFIDQHQSEFWVVEDETQLVGFLRIKGNHARRLSHSALVVVGIRQAYWNQKLGTRLFQGMEEWALQREIIRLELTVMVGNRRAVGGRSAYIIKWVLWWRAFTGNPLATAVAGLRMNI